MTRCLVISIMDCLPILRTGIGWHRNPWSLRSARGNLFWDEPHFRSDWPQGQVVGWNLWSQTFVSPRINSLTDERPISASAVVKESKPIMHLAAKTGGQFWWYLSENNEIVKIFVREMLIRILPTTPLQIFWELILYSEDIFKSIVAPDDTCQGVFWAWKG